MKTTTLLNTAISIALFHLAAATVGAQTIDTMPPVVVKTVPEAGTKNVPAGETEIRITFSKEMDPGGFSFVGPVLGAEFISVGSPAFSADQKTCVWKVKLEPGKSYGYWLNNAKFQNFRDKAGHPLVPYLFSFQTSKE